MNGVGRVNRNRVCDRMHSNLAFVSQPASTQVTKRRALMAKGELRTETHVTSRRHSTIGHSVVLQNPLVHSHISKGLPLRAQVMEAAQSYLHSSVPVPQPSAANRQLRNGDASVKALAPSRVTAIARATRMRGLVMLCSPRVKVANRTEHEIECHTICLARQGSQ